MNTFDQIAIKIIKEQELIIGPIAWLEAGKVEGLKVIDQKIGQLALEIGKERTVIDLLVGRYERLFGRASREVCREAAASLIADLDPSEVPASLQ